MSEKLDILSEYQVEVTYSEVLLTVRPRVYALIKGQELAADGDEETKWARTSARAIYLELQLSDRLPVNFQESFESWFSEGLIAYQTIEEQAGDEGNAAAEDPPPPVGLSS